MIPQIKKYLQENWEGYFPVKPQSIQLLLLANPQGKKITHGKITVLIFIDGNEEPEIVGKFLRTPQLENEKLTNEQHWLRELHTWGYSSKPLGNVVINDRTVTFEKFVPGISLKLKIQKKINLFRMKDISAILNDIELDFTKIARLLNELKNVKVTDRKNGYSYIDKTFQNATSLLNILNLTESEKLFFNNLLIRIEENNEPRTFVHFDFTPSNIIEHSNKLFLIDLEFSQMSSFAFLDAYRFVYYYFYLFHESRLLPYVSLEANFWFFFIKDSSLSKMVHNFINSTDDEENKLSFYESMLIFLLSNLQLQLDEGDIVSKEVINHKSKLIALLIDVSNGMNINESDFEENDPYGHFSKEMFVDEINRYQNVLNDYVTSINNKDTELSKNNSYIALCHKTIANKEDELKRANDYIEECLSTIHNKDKELENNILYIEKCHDTIANKEKQINDILNEVEKYNLDLNESKKNIEVFEERNVKLEKENQALKEELNSSILKIIKKRFMSRFKKETNK